MIIVDIMPEQLSLESRAIGCLLGGACGDALGHPVEHKKLEKIYEEYGENGIQAMKVEDGIAKITDDTQMTIYTAQGLLHAISKKCDYDGYIREVHLSYLRWLTSLLKNEEEMICLYNGLYLPSELKENDLLADGKNIGLDKKMCRGGSTFDALLSGERYSVSNPPEEGVRCGTIMRSAPIGIFCHDNPELAFRLGRDCGVLTHGVPSAYLAAGFMCMLLAYLLSGEELESSISKCMNYLKEQQDSEKLLKVLQKGIDLAKSPSEKALDDIQQIGLGWRADENLSISLYCLLRYKTNVREALIASVNHSGDSDSVGAVCGNLIGAYAGIDNIPEDFLVVQFKDLLIDQAKQLIHSPCNLQYNIC